MSFSFGVGFIASATATHLGDRRECFSKGTSCGFHPFRRNMHSLHWTISGKSVVGTCSNPAAARSAGCGAGALCGHDVNVARR